MASEFDNSRGGERWSEPPERPERRPQETDSGAPGSYGAPTGGRASGRQSNDYAHEPGYRDDESHQRATGQPQADAATLRPPSGSWRATESAGERIDPSHRFDPDYHEWRAEQMRQLDKEYALWRQERYRKFADDFESWRKQRLAGRTHARMVPPQQASQASNTSHPSYAGQATQPPQALGSANALGTTSPEPGPLRARSERERIEAADRPVERQERPDRAERMERIERSERTGLDKMERKDLPERTERPSLLSGLLGSHSSRK